MRLDTQKKSGYASLPQVHDQYSQDDKPIVGQILSKMVTDYYTKKRISKEELQSALPYCHNLDRLLLSLINHRIVKHSLGYYELIHDFLAKRVIEFIEKKKFVSLPVRKAIKFIESNYYKKDLTSGEIADAAGVSQMHLSVLFKEQLGNSINCQLNSSRIAAAKRLMSKDRELVSSVADNVGFKSLSVFSRKFKEIEGLSPLEYRSQLISNVMRKK